MDNNQIAAYLMEKERMAYQNTKERQKTLRWAILAILAAVIVYMLFVVPVEEETLSADNGSQIIEASSIGRDNINAK